MNREFEQCLASYGGPGGGTQRSVVLRESRSTPTDREEAQRRLAPAFWAYSTWFCAAWLVWCPRTSSVCVFGVDTVSLFSC